MADTWSSGCVVPWPLGLRTAGPLCILLGPCSPPSPTTPLIATGSWWNPSPLIPELMLAHVHGGMLYRKFSS